MTSVKESRPAASFSHQPGQWRKPLWHRSPVPWAASEPQTKEAYGAAIVPLITATDLEWGCRKRCLNYTKAITISDLHVDEAILGFTKGTISIMIKCAFKQSYISYGAIFAVLGLTTKLQFVFKIGTAAGHYDIRTVVVLARGEDNIVLHNQYLQSEVLDEGRVPSAKAIAFSYEASFTNFCVAQISITSGPTRVTESQIVKDIYEWEASSIWQAI